MEIKCYCDSNLNPKTKTAFICWIIADFLPKFQVIHYTKNTSAEIIRIINLMDSLDKDKKYIFYADCQTIIY